MIDDEVMAVILAIMVVAGMVGYASMLRESWVGESFSAIGILGPEKRIGDYPREVVAGQGFRLWVFVANYEGRVMYYSVIVKLGNESSIPNSTAPSTADEIKRVELILPSGGNATLPIDLNITRVGRILLIFELWYYTSDSLEPRYSGKWAHLWLNVTGVPRG